MADPSAPLGAERAQERLRELAARFREMAVDDDNAAREHGLRGHWRTQAVYRSSADAWRQAADEVLTVAPVVAQEPGHKALRTLASMVLCVRLENQPEFMYLLADSLTDAAHELGETDIKVTYDGDGFTQKPLPSSPSSGSAHEKNETTTTP